MLETAPDGTSHPTADRSRGTHRDDATRSGLVEYLAALRRYWWVALATFLVVLVVAVGSLFVLGPVYRSDAEVLVRTEDSRQLFPRTGGTSAGALIRSPAAELVYVSGDEFQQLAAEAAGGEAEVEVRAAAESSSLLFVAEAGAADAARDAAQTWAETYVATRHASDVAETTALRDLLIADRDALQARQQEILQPVAALDEAVAVETDPVELSRLLNQRLAIQRTLSSELDPVETELRRLNTQIASLEVDLRVMGNPEALAYISSAAELPEERADGSLRRNLLVGVVAGLVLAGGAVAAAQALSRR
ncbi:Wzz/FepE/Etk N-terminal domain-containing protein [Blastococcus sp. SYSU DS0669]